MTGTVSYFVDCASYQGAPDWGRVAAVCAGGAEKVTEGTGYVNPRWAAAKPAMKAAAARGFVPAAYMFMDARGTGAAQAQFFSRAAGDLTGFGIVVDLERAPDGSPTIAQARDAVAELRRLYPRHPIGGYCPHWYTGGADLTFTDWLWASEYVSGSGDPAMLYRQVPASWWAPYGGRSPLMLQFTSRATVAGVSGPVDCSAFNGGATELAIKVVTGHVPPPAVPTPMLKPGATGSAVRNAQLRLNVWGAAPRLVLDGVFGPATLAAVRTFQGRHGLSVDGVIGPHTWAALLSNPPAR